MSRSKIRIVRLVALLALVMGTARADAEMVLTAAGVAQGFGLSTFATSFPNSGTNGYGPFGIAFPTNGGVLVSDLWDGTVNRFPTDRDNQSDSDPGVTHQNNFNSLLGYYYTPAGLAMSGGKVYLAIQNSASQFGGSGSLARGVYQLNDDGTVNHLVAALDSGATGIVTDPSTGHLFVSSLTSNSMHIYDINPITGGVVDWTATHGGAGVHADGLTFSPDGQTLYAAIFGLSIQSYKVNTGGLLFDAPIPFSDGTALGFGTLTGNIFANTNDGKIWEINLATGAQTLIASGGSRGDFVTVDPTNGTLLLTQTDRVLRLTAPSGGSFLPIAVPEPSSIVSIGLGLACLAGHAGWRRIRSGAMRTAGWPGSCGTPQPIGTNLGN